MFSLCRRSLGIMLLAAALALGAGCSAKKTARVDGDAAAPAASASAGVKSAASGAAPASPPATVSDSASAASQAASPAAASASADDPQPTIPDPIEPWNRFWFGFNDVFYTYLGKPVNFVYTTATPKYLRERIENAYSNILFPARFINALLQLRPDKASRELGRFIINSTFGLGGLYDLAATKEDMAPQRLDFGQTLGVWGMGPGFYLVLPILGPSSLRDTVGIAADATMQPTTYIDFPYLLTAGISGVGRINRLDDMLKIYEEMKRSSIEPYTATRDAFFQLRTRMIMDARRSAWVPMHRPE